MLKNSFSSLVFSATRKIPCGRVATYAAVARAIGRPGAARAVGNALNKNPYHTVPCHRVIRSGGDVGGFVRGTRAKIRLLKKEGVKFTRGRIDSSCVIPELPKSIL